MPLNLVPPVATSIRVRRDTNDGKGRVFGLLAAGKHGEHITSVHADLDLKPDDRYFMFKRPSEDLVGAQATWAHGDDKWSLSMGHSTRGSQSDIVACLSVETLNCVQQSDVAKVLPEVDATRSGRRVRVRRMVQGNTSEVDSIATRLPSTDASSVGASFLLFCVHAFNRPA